jgi:hypothetical protein
MPPPQPGEPDAAAVAAQVNQAREALRVSTPPPAPPSAVDHLKDQVLDNWKIPAIAAATYVGAKAVEYGGKKAIEKGKSVLENRRIAKEANANINRNVDIPFFEPPPAPPLFTPGAPESKLAVESQAKFGAPLADVEKHFNVKISNLKDAEILTGSYKNYMNSLSGAVSNQPSGIPNTTSAMNQLTGGATPPAPIANAVLPPSSPPPSVSDTVATGGNVTKTVTQNIANDLDVLTKKEQGMKNWLLNQYGGKNEPMAHEAYSQVKNILGYTPAYPEGSKGGSLAPEEKGKILDWRKQELPGPKVNLTHDMKKALKIGGPVAAALIATTEFANAKTAEEKANAGANLLGAILPPGADIRDVGAPTLNNQQISNAALLGSPYAQTEWAKKERQRNKAGAGQGQRGIAPPSNR